MYRQGLGDCSLYFIFHKIDTILEESGSVGQLHWCIG